MLCLVENICKQSRRNPLASTMALFAALQCEPDLNNISLMQIMAFTRLLFVVKHDTVLFQP